MRAVIQRVSEASVVADGTLTGKIGKGLMILLGVHKGDTETDSVKLAEKISKLRIFCDSEGKMNLSVNDVGGSVLIISNFTLYANYAHGNRPDYFDSEEPAKAERLYAHFIGEMKKYVPEVSSGVFGADMKVSLLNDGPVTIVMDSEVLTRKENSK